MHWLQQAGSNCCAIPEASAAESPAWVKVRKVWKQSIHSSSCASINWKQKRKVNSTPAGNPSTQHAINSRKSSKAQLVKSTICVSWTGLLGFIE